MPRKLFHLTVVAARKRDLVLAWERLGFAVDPDRGCIALADEVVLDFFAPDDGAPVCVEELQPRAFLAHFATRRSGVALFSLDSAGPARSEPLFGAEAYVRLAPQTFLPAPGEANGVRGLLALVAVAENPADHGEALAPLTGQREMRATSAGLEIPLAGGTRLDILTPAAFAFRFGAPAPETGSFRLGGLVFAVDRLEDTQKFFARANVAVVRQGERLLAGVCEGVAVAFEQN